MIDKRPKSGWLGPPSTIGLAAIATAVGSKRGKWVWKQNRLTNKERKAHKEFQKAMAKADQKDKWRFKW